MLEAERAAVVAAGRRLAASGLVVGTSGNLSARAGDLVVVTPTGCSIAEMRPEDLVVVDRSGTVVEGAAAPTSELPFHLAVYAATGTGAIAHTHAVASVAVSCLCEELPALHYTCVLLGGPPRVAPYATFGSTALADGLVAALAGGRQAALLAHHGSVALGDDLAAACERLELLEWLCGLHLAVVGAHGGPPPSVLDAAALAAAADRFGVPLPAEG